MSKLVPNVTAAARIFRGQPMFGTWSATEHCICLTTRCLAFEISKQEPKARMFADKAMIQHAGGPWFIQSFKSFLEPRLSELRSLHLLVRLGDVEAKDLFSYRTCPIALELNHDTLPNPIALQIVQKARLFAIVDEELERQIGSL